MRRKQSNNDPNYNVIVFWTKSAVWDVVPWTLISQTKPGFTAVDKFECRYQDKSGMYCVFLYMF